MRFFRKKKKMESGITLVEVLVGVAVFATIAISATVLFGSASQSKNFSKDAQKKYNAAFTAVGEMGKFLITSTTNLTLSQGGVSSLLYVYSYSTQECVEFSFASSTLTVRRASMLDTENYKNCSGTFLTGLAGSGRVSSSVMIQDVQGGFYIQQLNRTAGSEQSGFITIRAKVYDGDPSDSESKWIPLETTLSLRDYLVND